MITVVSNLLTDYASFMNRSNARFGVKVFEFFIEMLQGPCFENQKEVCSSKLMETVEDLLIDLVNIGAGH